MPYIPQSESFIINVERFALSARTLYIEKEGDKPYRILKRKFIIALIKNNLLITLKFAKNNNKTLKGGYYEQ
jgi:hypothetical protein